MKSNSIKKISLKGIALVGFVAMAFAGCMAGQEGVDPPSDQLIFPVGLATTNNDGHLIVVNSNFDLAYNAGTVVALDLNKLNSMIEDSRVNGTDGLCTLASNGDYCFVDEAKLIDTSQTVRVGAFASDLTITRMGDRLLIPVRGERAITLIDVDDDGPQLLSCGQGSDRRCDSAHRVTSNADYTLPIEPYNVATKEYVDGDVIHTLGFATHLAGGEVSVFSVSTHQPGVDPIFHSDLLGVVNGVVPGASGIAANPINDDIYVVGRHDANPHIAVLEVFTDSAGSVLNNPWFNQSGYISVEDELYAGTDARGVAVSSDGSRGVVVTRNPAALLKIDLESYDLTDMTTVCSQPSRVEIFEQDETVYAMVMCFLTKQVYIVDTDLMQTTVRDTGAGPQALAFDDTAGRIFVANFRESTITVLKAQAPFVHERIGIMPAEGSGDPLPPIIRIGQPSLP